jgi:hypothetical protein
MTTTKYRRFLWQFLEECSTVTVAIYMTAPFIIVEQLSTGKVRSALEIIPVTCVNGQITAIDGLESSLSSYLGIPSPVICTGGYADDLFCLRT